MATTKLGAILRKVSQSRKKLRVLPLDELKDDLLTLKDHKDELDEMVDTLRRVIRKLGEVVEELEFEAMDARGADDVAAMEDLEEVIANAEAPADDGAEEQP